MHLSIRFGILLLAAHLSLPGQRPTSRPKPQIWDGDNLYAIGDNNVVVERRDGLKGDRFNGPQTTVGFDVFEGDSWATSFTRTTTPTIKDGRVTSILKRIGKEWVKQADFEYKHGLIHHIHPLGNGRFWALSSRSGNFVDDEGYSYPLAILSKNPETGKLRIHSTMDFGLAKPFFNRTKNISSNDGTDSPYQAFAFDMLDPVVIRTSDYIVLCMPDPGYFWIFKNSNGQLKHHLKLYSVVSEELVTTKFRDLAPSILSIHPRSDGMILISARSEDAVEQAARAYRESIPPIGSDQDYMKHYPKIQEAWDLNLHLFPRVVWWVLDPETGSLHEEEPPHSFPSVVRDFAELRAFRWQFKPDGNLLYLGIYQQEPQVAEPKTAQSKKSEQPKGGKK